MAFMIIFVFLFFAIAGLFVASVKTNEIRASASNLQRESTISSITPLADMPELNCESGVSMCIDEDKIYALSEYSNLYRDFWPVASIEVRKVFPKQSQEIVCPQPNCTIYKVYDSNQNEVQTYGTFVSLCKKVREDDSTRDVCTIARLEVGVKIKS